MWLELFIIKKPIDKSLIVVRAYYSILNFSSNPKDSISKTSIQLSHDVPFDLHFNR